MKQLYKSTFVNLVDQIKTDLTKAEDLARSANASEVQDLIFQARILVAKARVFALDERTAKKVL